jgi:hypothetical protein
MPAADWSRGSQLRWPEHSGGDHRFHQDGELRCRGHLRRADRKGRRQIVAAAD